MGNETNYTQIDRAKIATKITWIGLWLNVFLTLLKFVAGIFGKSSAMIADAIHSLSDFITDFVVIISFKIVKKPIDDTHDYGHGKFETLASFLVGISLIVVAVGIFLSGLDKVLSAYHGEKLEQPGFIALFAAAISIGIKEFLYRYQVGIGKKINSQAVIANAWHHRSDALSSIGTLVGIGGAVILGNRYAVLDPIAAMVVSFFIVKVAYQITIFSVNELLEVALPKEDKQKIMQYVLSVQGAENPHRLRTRKIGSYLAIEMHIEVERDLTLLQAHSIADNVENLLREKLGYETIVTVHVDPKSDVSCARSPKTNII